MTWIPVSFDAPTFVIETFELFVEQGMDRDVLFQEALAYRSSYVLSREPEIPYACAGDFFRDALAHHMRYLVSLLDDEEALRWFDEGLEHLASRGDERA